MAAGSCLYPAGQCLDKLLDGVAHSADIALMGAAIVRLQRTAVFGGIANSVRQQRFEETNYA